LRILGLTGGVGMGKSTAATFLAERGLSIVDTDVLARDLVQPGRPALAEIQATFGPEFVSADGQIRRDLLATRVFADPQARQQLESILHPLIRSEWKRQVDIWASEGQQRAVVVIPLLFETKAEAEFNSIICAACSSATQRSRLAGRGWSDQEIAQRIAAQLPIDDKIARSNFVLWTEGGLDVHARQIDLILARLP
jgi:dephospho-CoA kinase